MVSIGINTIIASKNIIKRHRPQDANLIQNQKIKPSGILSSRTRLRLKSTLENWLATENKYQNAPINALTPTPAKPTHKANPRGGCVSANDGRSPKNNQIKFVTLTIQTADEPNKRKFLNAFLIAAKRAGITHVFWIAERGASGQLHFHLITNCWNDAAAESWRRITANWNKNAVVVRPVRNFPKLIRYILKGSSQPIQGRIWGMTKTVKAFENVRLDKAEEIQLFREHGHQMQLSYKNDWCAFYKPTGRLKTKIAAHFLKIRRSQSPVALPTVRPRRSRNLGDLSQPPPI